MSCAEPKSQGVPRGKVQDASQLPKFLGLGQ